MAWLELCIDAGPYDPAELETALTTLGALAVTLTDAGDDPVLEPPPGATVLWPATRVTGLFPAGTQADALLAGLGAVLDGPLPHCRVTRLDDRVWEREWLRDFGPMRFGRRLWVCPGDTVAGATGAVTVRLDPGLAFGTGTHPTTALCLTWLDEHPPRGLRVLDYGCGSGILGIAALKLGAAGVVATDIDTQALEATARNALRNGVHDALALSTPEPLPAQEFDLILANILAGPLEALAPRFAALTRPGGHIVLSGLLQEQVPGIADSYAAAFEAGTHRTRDGWAMFSAVRRNGAPGRTGVGIE